MSWSINLYGPKAVVEREVADALLALDKALDWVVNADDDAELNVGASGYVDWNADTAEIISSTVNSSFTESQPTPPPAPEPKTCLAGPRPISHEDSSSV